MVICYPVRGKSKSKLICEAFAQGCGGVVSETYLPGDSFFYGVTGSALVPWEKREAFYYSDNSYFDAGREKYFRITKNAFQITESPVRDYRKLDALGLKFGSHSGGRHVVVVEQSESFLRLSGYRGNWLEKITQEIRKHTDRPIRVRRWTPRKAECSATLHQDLKNAWCLVTHMSAAANEAILSGVPVFVTGECSARPLASGPLSRIERPRYPEGVRDWAAGLAANQWTLDEIKSGDAWRFLNA